MSNVKPISNLRYLPSLIPPFIALFGNILGGFWTLGNILLLFGLGIPDRFLKKIKPEPYKEQFAIADGILILHVVLHTSVIFSLLYGVYSGSLSGLFLLLAVISTGMNSGSSATLSAHELIHRRSNLKFLGIWSFFLINYASYYIEHIQGHHKNVATSLDSSTAKKGQSFYNFFFKALPWQFSDALKIEAKRLSNKNKLPYSLENFVIRVILLKLVLLSLIFIWTGWLGILAFVGQSIISRLIHESISYAQHYGLVRRGGDRVNQTHAWESDSFLGEILLLELTKHSDHHFHAVRHYPELISYQEKSPQLPFGYYSLLPIILLPPLWFKLINPILEEFESRNI